MILKLSFFTILFAIVIVGSTELSFSMESVWKDCKKDGESRPAYIDGIQQYYDDIIESFGKIPPPLSNEAEIVVTTLQNFLAKLIIFSYSNSTVLSSSSVAILETVSQVNVSAKTPLGIIEEFQRMLPTLMQSYRTVVSNLSSTIGGVSGFVNVAMTDLEMSYRNHMTEFLQNDEHGLKKSVDFKPIARHAQTLTSTISLIAATIQNKCESGTSELHGALMTLTLVLDHVMICFLGLSGCGQAVLHEQNSGEAVVVLEFHSTLGVFTSGITNSLDAKNIGELSTSLTSYTDILNSTFNNLFGAFDGVAATAGDITKNISKNISGAVCGITNKLTDPLGGLGLTKPLRGLGGLRI